MSKELEIQSLLTRIKKRNEEYRLGTPSIDDVQYDKLVDRLREIDPDNEWFSRPEPAPVSGKRKVMLPVPMKSLDKAKDMNGLTAWINTLGLRSQQRVVIMPKFDGLSMLYNEGTARAYTRGGAENEGQDCAAHAAVINAGDTPDDVCQFTYGEIVFSRESWNLNFAGKASPETGMPYRSPRNTAAGLMNRDTPDDALKHLSFYRYGTDIASLMEFSRFTELLDHLNSTHSQPPLYRECAVQSLSHEFLSELFLEWSLSYFIDGLVIYVNDLMIWNIVGRHQGSGNPKYAIAYKHPDFTATFETTVKGVTWNISKSGAFKPVVNMNTVDTGDCNMENPTGYNAAWIDKMKIAAGAKILVTRSGGVIPKILSTIEPASEEELLKARKQLMFCPHCGCQTEWNQNKIELCCVNPECPGRKFAETIFFFLTCGAENMGEETFRKLFSAGYDTIRKILDITVAELIKIEGIGLSAAQEITANNSKIKKGVGLVTLMHASNCFVNIGKAKAQNIIDNMSDDDVKRMCHNTPLSLEDNDLSLYSVTMQSFITGLPRFRKLVGATAIAIEPPMKTDARILHGKLKNMFICFSGFRNEALEAQIVQEGGQMTYSINSKTSVLIVKDRAKQTTKSVRAISKGVPIMLEEEFCDRFLREKKP